MKKTVKWAVILNLVTVIYAIVGGRKTVIQKYPFVASIRDPRSHSCGGVIISVRFVLTAAHCTYKTFVRSLRVVVGTSLRRYRFPMDEHVFMVLRAEIHPDFKPHVRKNDIALLLLDRDIENPFVRPISLPDANFDHVNEETVIAVGWGSMDYQVEFFSRVLNEVELEVMSTDECVKKLKVNDFYKKIFFCTKSQKNKGTNNGDSGGPVVSSSHSNTLIGLIYFGQENYYGDKVFDLHINVHYYRPWIESEKARLTRDYGTDIISNEA